MIKETFEKCMRKCFDLREDYPIDFNKPLDEFGINSISLIKLLVLLETELEVEFDETTFNLSNYRTPNRILEYVADIKCT